MNALDAFSEHNFTGLTTEQVKEKQRLEGPNALPDAKGGGWLSQLVGVFKEPMFLLLIACGSLYLVLGDLQEGLMLMGFVLLMIGIEWYQERKTGKALEALKDLSSPQALVIREGVLVKVPCKELVTGDLVLVSEGDRVPADGLVLHAINLQVDESLLTGESVPVRKREGDKEADEVSGYTMGGDDTPYVFSGTLVVQGNGVFEVNRIGVATEMGRIGVALSSIKPSPTRLKLELNALVKKLALMGIGLCLVVVVVYVLTRGQLLNGVLAGLTLAMAVIPEEFPVIMTVFMALGAWRMSKHRVLARKPNAIEALGSATVLCSDKTGTLTENKMTVSELYNKETFLKVGEASVFPEAFHSLIEYGILASQTHPNDPMEKAILDMGDRHLANTEHLHHDWSMLREYPLTREMLAMSRVYRQTDDDHLVIAAKGAPETIFDLCHLADATPYEAAIERMASAGLRVLGVAEATIETTGLPENQHDFAFEFLGLIGLSDPVRPEVSASVDACHGAGIRVIMLTGDYPVTAQNIGQEIGLTHSDHCLTGAQLRTLSETELSAALRETSIIARVVPEQKLTIVNALQRNGEVVAMTGDGVNDAPALKAAHIGIAMGERGTDVAREAASLVLTDDNFSSIVSAVQMGRRIYDNMQKAFGYVLAIHVPIIGLSVVPVFFAQAPLLLFPMHVAFLELIIDPACSVVFESEEAEASLMKRPPRPAKGAFFSNQQILTACLHGLFVMLMVFAVYGWALYRGYSDEVVRTLSFTTLLMANLATIMTWRSREKNIFQILKTPNASVKWILGLALGALTAALTVPFLRDLFAFGQPRLGDLLIAAVAGGLSMVGFEIYKTVKKRKRVMG